MLAWCCPQGHKESDMTERLNNNKRVFKSLIQAGFSLYFSCHYCCLVAKSCVTLCHSLDHSPPDSSVHEISQARILERVFIFFTRDLPNPGIKPGSPALQADSLPLNPQGAVKDAEHNPNAQLTIILIDPASSSSTFLVHFRILLLTPLVGGLCVCT